jgi:hypothetical protein
MFGQGGGILIKLTEPKWSREEMSRISRAKTTWEKALKTEQSQ